MIEKTGEVKPGTTPDTESKLGKEKTAGDPSVIEQTKKLDDDATKRLADAASK
jgi:hypothetical protein